MLLLLALLGFALAGGTGIAWAIGLGSFLLFFAPRVSPQMLLRMNKARPIGQAEAPRLHHIVQVLAQRAALSRPPRLYYVPNRMMNAFATGNQHDAVIGVTDGLLRGLSERELTAVLAHEIGHIRNNDLKTAAFAALINRLTRLFSGLGQILLFLNLPLVLMGQTPFSWWAIMLLLAAPSLSSLLQLALSRTREFDADLEAIRLSNDPTGLAMALQKIEQSSLTPFQRLFGNNRQPSAPTLFRTHPHTQQRVERLVQVGGQPVSANRRPQIIFQ